MKKISLVIALICTITLAHANTITLFSNLSCYNNTYSCSLPNVGPDYQVTDCTFNFASVNTGYNGYLNCNLVGNNSDCNLGYQNGSTSTWACTLDSNEINYLNNCISSGGHCDFNLNCYGYYNIGSCTVNYDCSPCYRQCVPDTAMTIVLLGLTLLCLEMIRRKFWSPMPNNGR